MIEDGHILYQTIYNQYRAKMRPSRKKTRVISKIGTCINAMFNYSQIIHRGMKGKIF